MRISDWSSDVCSSDLRGEHYPHPTGIGLFQRPARLRIDILIAGEHRAKPRFDAVRERQRLELARHFDAAGIRDTGPQRPLILGLLSRTEERRVGKECVRRWRSRWSTYH